MSYYIRRSKADRKGWTGPIRSERQADREVAAWQSIGWDARREVSTPEVRAEVRTWERTVRAQA